MLCALFPFLFVVYWIRTPAEQARFDCIEQKLILTRVKDRNAFTENGAEIYLDCAVKFFIKNVSDCFNY